MYDQNISRWTIASINKYFMDNRQWVPLYVNNQIYQDDEFWAELRITGPSVNQYSRDLFVLNCTINILLTAFAGVNDYKIYEMAGIFVAAMGQICCYKYGNYPQDDQTQFGTLQLERGIAGKVDVVHFGLISPENKFRRSFVETNYCMWL